MESFRRRYGGPRAPSTPFGIAFNMAENKEIVLDDEAEALFRDLGGVDAVRSGRGVSVPDLAEAIHDQEKRLDAWRLLLVDLVFDFGRFLDACRGAESAAARDALAQMTLHLEKLSRMPQADGRILIRHRGRPVPESGRVSGRYDYIILFGNIRLDVSGARQSARRLGVTAAKLPVRIQEAFLALSTSEISSASLQLGAFDAEERAAFKKSMEALYFFRVAALSGKDGPVPLIRDETGTPDPNLSLLFAISGVKPEAGVELSRKVRSMLLSAPPGDALEQFLGIYDAVFAFKKLRDQLKRPAVEINNTRWLLASSPGESIPAVRARVARLAAGSFGKGSPLTSRIMDVLYASDYGAIDAVEFCDRLEAASQLLPAVEKGLPHGLLREEARTEILGNLESRMTLVRDEVYDEVSVRREILKAKDDESSRKPRWVDTALVEKVEFFQHRGLVKEKMKGLAKGGVSFDAEDLSVMARDFSVPAEEIARLVELLKAAFDTRGRFLRGSFEKNIPAFARHGSKVFEFVWHYLKDLVNRADRIALLNALQVLIDQMKSRREAFTVLMEDFVRDPETIEFHDRNALMLANLMLRKYNKELHNDIEVTPEEVLLVREGLDPEMTACAGAWMEAEKERLLVKLRTVHRSVREALDASDPGKAMPLRYVFTLEREVSILLALVGGPIAAAVLRSALSEYGNPDAEIYWLKRSEANVTSIIGILQVLVRAVCRSPEGTDLDSLRNIERRENRYLTLNKEQRHADAVRRLMQWVDRACETVGESTDSSVEFRF